MFIILLLIILCILFIDLAGKRNYKDNASYLIILGFALKDDQIQPMLIERLNKAIDYLHDHVDTIVIVTGGITKNNSVSEAKVMKDYLLAHQITNTIIQEDQSLDTYENLKNSKENIHGEGILITNQFHMLRALRIANKAGYTHIHGLSAKNGKGRIYCLLRELLAWIICGAKGQL